VQHLPLSPTPVSHPINWGRRSHQPQPKRRVRFFMTSVLARPQTKGRGPAQPHTCQIAKAEAPIRKRLAIAGPQRAPITPDRYGISEHRSTDTGACSQLVGRPKEERVCLSVSSQHVELRVSPGGDGGGA
jgi:hypothetical protein